MLKTVKYLAIAFSALLALLLIVVGIVAATFNPNDYKPLLIRLVQEKKQRTLSIPGDIKLTFFPRIGADLGKVSISEHKGIAEFASVGHAKVSLELMPLLSKQLIVNHIQVDDLKLSLTRFKDGTTSIDDLLTKEESDGQQIKFDVDSVDIARSSIFFDDRQMNRKTQLTQLNLETGRIANGVPSKLAFDTTIGNDNPRVDAQVTMKSGFTIDIEQKHYVLKNLDAEFKGRLADLTGLVIKASGNADVKPANKQFALDDIVFTLNGKRAAQVIETKFDLPKLAITDTKVSSGKLTGAIKLTEGARVITTDFSAPSFEGSPQAFKIPSLTLDATIKDAQRNAKAKIAGSISGDIDKLLFASPQLALTLEGKQGGNAIGGTLTTPFSVNMKTNNIDFPKIAGVFTLPSPAGGSLTLKADGKVNADLAKQAVSAALKGSLDESAFDAKLGLVKFSSPAYTFDVSIDRIDVDRYKGKPAAATTAAAPEQPIDLSALKSLNAHGSLKIGSLKAANIKASNVRLDVHAASGKVDVNPLAANLYGGSTSGSVSVTASNPPRFSVRQNLAGISVGSLLKDAIGKAPVDGKGNVQLDVTTQGALVGQMKKSLNGTARLELRDGAVHGINVAQKIREAKAKIGAIKGSETPQAGTGSGNEQTDFSELTGSFRIVNGVAHNDDLAAKSPLIRLGGSGDINIGEDRLDYLVKATVVSSLQGQGGPELQALKGITIPVKLAGPFTAIGWKIDFSGMASALAKQKIDEKKEEVKGKLQDQLQNKLKGLFGR